MGGGLINVSPEENQGLFNDIITSGGLAISEYPDNKEAKSEHFPIRNRIIAGISLGVVVIEAGYRSGASLTAKIAKEQGKKIFCVPCNVDSKYVGTNELIKEGAILISNSDEILEELDISKTENLHKESDYRIQNKLPKINSEYKEIYNELSGDAVHINQICRNINKDISYVSSILTILELEGYIEQLPGKLFKLL